MADVKLSDGTTVAAPVGTSYIPLARTSGTPGNDKVLSTYYLAAEKVTSPVAWTPANTQGCGTLAASNLRSHRVGSYLYFDGVVTLGTTTGSEMRIELGYNGTSGNVTTSSSIGTLEICGIIGSSSNGGRAAFVLCEASKTYITVGWADLGVTNTLTKLNGSNFTSSSQLSISGRVLIQGW